jgi:hypothetical protein
MINHARVTSLRKSLTAAAVVLFISALAAAALIGAVLGVAGSLLSDDLRAAIVVTAVAALAVGALRSEVPWQRNVETPRAWLEFHSWQTVVRNGSALGTGFATRLGFWLWYLVPLGAFAVGGAAAGAFIYMSYAAARLGISVMLSGASFAFDSSWPVSLAQSATAPIRRISNDVFFSFCGFILAIAIYSIAIAESSF